MSIFIRTIALIGVALLAISLAGGTTNARAQASRGFNAPNAREQTVFVPPKTVVRIKDRSVFVKGANRSMTILVDSPTAPRDTARLATEAMAVVAAEASLIDGMRATDLSVAFQALSQEITVQGLTPTRPTSVSFARGPDGKWQQRRIPPKKIGRTVVPGRP